MNKLTQIILNILRPTVTFANVGEGTHEGTLTRRATAAITEKFLFVKPGADSDHVAVCSSGGDIPIGVATDEAEAAEDAIAVALLGATANSLQVRSGGAISVGDFIVTNASGQAITLPATTGTYYITGRALHGANSGELLEFDPCVPVQRTV